MKFEDLITLKEEDSLWIHHLAHFGIFRGVTGESVCYLEPISGRRLSAHYSGVVRWNSWRAIWVEIARKYND